MFYLYDPIISLRGNCSVTLSETQRGECNCEKDNLTRCQRLAAERANHM
jgi:hypothetical protein